MKLVRLCIVSLFKQLSEDKFIETFKTIPIVIQQQLTDFVLELVVVNGKLNIVKYFAEDCGVNILYLELAAIHGRIDIVRYLVEEHRLDVRAINDLDFLLQFVIMNGHRNVVKYLKSLM